MQTTKKINSTKGESASIIQDDDKTNEVSTLFHQTEEYLSNHYQLRFNTIALDIEMAHLGSEKWESCNDNSLWVEIRKKGIQIGQNALKAILKSDYVARYNPIANYFKTITEWDGQIDYISQYASYVKLATNENKEQFLYHFKKWCVRAVKCALIEGYFNKQAFVLTDDGNGQNMGKSTWCRNLCPPKLSKYIAEDISNNDKDSRILICKNFLINLDELAALSKKEINQLKSLFSKDQINDRLPYDSKNSIIPRVASFIGSTNMSTFLHDETGSVRWLCFVIEDIDWSYNTEFNIDNLWAQAFTLSNDPYFIAELTREDLLENERRNDKFQFLTAERETLNAFLEPSNPQNGEHLTATKITTYLKSHSGISLNNVQVGKALKACGFERTKVKNVHGYYVKYKAI
ncbi:virulence-associated E family protein [Tamlana fucoidanivorans]|uniref:Virulence-associated E family protein n=1 Tax=Allotamlana fucoidanivorans TaxID=2583814 RepID=A0A5C4SCZ4_9FLAO|nr:VapE domain-containing protein [Tamlana fucoidanivorans]TNJ41348.1 virulence-associated E family protein [Tamlana fucoidanivorans]